MPLLHVADILLTLVHVIIIGFNLLGWIWPRTRKWHFIFAMLTAASWFILGIWFGIGYCPFTDWQWQVKRLLGERNLPASFVEYYAEKICRCNFSSHFIDMVTLISFLMAVCLSIYFNFVHPKLTKHNKAI